MNHGELFLKKDLIYKTTKITAHQHSTVTIPTDLTLVTSRKYITFQKEITIKFGLLGKKWGMELRVCSH